MIGLGGKRHGTAPEPGGLPVIPGYDVWLGKVLLHARARPGFARGGRPFHVTAPTPYALVRALTAPKGSAP